MGKLVFPIEMGIPLLAAMEHDDPRFAETDGRRALARGRTGSVPLAYDLPIAGLAPVVPSKRKRPATRLAQAALLALAFLPVAGGDGHAQTGPGSSVVGLAAKGVAEDLVRQLYGIPTGPVLLHAPECGRSPCRVRLLKEAAWPTGPSEANRLVVAAAEPQDGVGHVSGTILGIGLFQRHGTRWSLKMGSPRVDAVGGWGSAPEVEIVEAGAFGRAVVATPGFTAQGITEAYWTLYLPIAGKYRRSLNLKTMLDRSGQCQPADAACTAEDFSSAVSIASAPDGGIDITQVKRGPAFNSSAGTASRWHVSRSGRVRALGASVSRKAGL